MKPQRKIITMLIGLALTLTSLAGWQTSRVCTERAVAPRPGDEGLNPPDQAKRTKPGEVYGKLPLSFEVNQGQFDSRVRFASRGSGHALFLTSTEAMLAVSAPAQSPPINPDLSSTVSDLHRTAAAVPKSKALRMKLVDANANAAVTGLEQLPGKSNYFIGNDPGKWRVNVPHYARVKCEQVYAGVDLVYYGKEGQVEYDYVLAPGTNPDIIRLSIGGADSMRIDQAGDLIPRTWAASSAISGMRSRWIPPETLWSRARHLHPISRGSIRFNQLTGASGMSL